MKNSAVLKHFVSIIALMLSLVILLTACGGGENTSDANDVSLGETLSQGQDATNNESATEKDDDDTQSDNDNNQNQTNSTTSKNNNVNSTDNNSKQTNTNNKNSSKDQTTNNNNNDNNNDNKNNNDNNTTVNSSKNVFDKDIYGSIPDSVKKKGIHMLMWRGYEESEKKLIAGFEKKTGIKVRTTVTTLDEYQTKLIALIGGKDSPDVVVLAPKQFPGAVTKSCQPLDEKMFRLDDKCWYKPYMDEYSYNGRYYGLAMNKCWNCEDTNYVTFYLKNTLAQCGISTTPYQLYKQGKWNWQKQKEIALKAKNAGLYGISFTYDDTMMYSAGTRFVNYNGKEFSSNLSDPALLNAWKEVAELKEKGAMNGVYDLTTFQQGKIGLFVGITYNMWKDSNTFEDITGGVNNIEAVPVAGPTQNSAYTPVRTKTWGVAKGAKNPEGAAYFLRYYLDINNTDFDNQFIHKQFKEVFNIITASNAKKASASNEGIVAYVDKKAYISLTYNLANTTSAQVQTVLNKKKGAVDTAIKMANRDLQRVK